MRDYTSADPVFSESIPIVEEDDLVNAENNNAVAIQLLQNILVLEDTKANKSELENVDNTSDMAKPVSTAQQAALDDIYQQLTAYTNQKIADLINGAPESLDTLKEVSAAIAAHKSIMDALDAAIGKKASAAEFDSHVKDAVKHITAAERTKWNGKAENAAMTGATASSAGKAGLAPAPAKGVQNSYLTGGGIWQNVDDHAAVFTSGDAASPTGWADVGVIASGEKLSSLMRKFSLAVKNVRYLWKLLGSTSLAGIGDGTVTGAVSALNTHLQGVYHPIKIAIKDYDIKPTSNNSIVDLDYNLSDIIPADYVMSQVVDVKVLYTDSYRYQQVTIAGLNSNASVAKIMCRIYVLLYRKSTFA